MVDPSCAVILSIVAEEASKVVLYLISMPILEDFDENSNLDILLYF